MKTTTHTELKTVAQNICILEGGNAISDLEHDYVDKWIDAGFKVKEIKHLYDRSHYLAKMVKFDTVAIFTTGTYVNDVKKLIEKFKLLNYAPKNVIFLSEETTMICLNIARELKAKHGTQFFQPDFEFPCHLYEIDWI